MTRMLTRRLLGGRGIASARPPGLRWLAQIGAVAFLLGLWWFVYLQLEAFARWFTFGLLAMNGTRFAEAVEFFVYEAPKVLMLLVLVVFVVGILRTFFTPERTRAILASKGEFTGNVLGSLLGIVTPFCSCSAVPLFIGFVTTGVPLGATFSFLTAAPMVNEVALVLLFGLFGYQVALLYLGTGLFIAMLSGFVIGRLHLERWVAPWVYETAPRAHGGGARQDWSSRVAAGRRAVREIVGKVWPYLLAGIAVGAGIHGYVPEDFMASIMGKTTWWSVPLAVLLGVPMYSNAAGIIPIVQALLGKGAALGTVLAFMMAVIGLSLPEMIILRKVLERPLIVTFVGVVTVGILAVGYLFNLLV